MKHPQENELREEFEKECFCTPSKIPSGVCRYDKKEIADWWLQKLSSEKDRVRKQLNPTEIAERIVIEYANSTGREDKYRAYVRKSAVKVLEEVLQILK